MKRKFNKIPLIILLIAGIVLSGTAVLALNNDITDFMGVNDDSSGESSTPPMLEADLKAQNELNILTNSDKSDIAAENSDSSLTNEIEPQSGDTAVGDEEQTEKVQADDVADENPDAETSDPVSSEADISEANKAEDINSEENSAENDESAKSGNPESADYETSEVNESAEPAASVNKIADGTAETQSNADKAQTPNASKSVAVKRTVDNNNGENNTDIKNNTQQTNEGVAPTAAVQTQNGAVNVLVINPSNVPVSGATVSISSGSAVVNSGGWGTIIAPAGNYVYVANAAGYRASAGNLTVTPNDTATVIVVLVPESSGNVADKYSASFVIRNQIGEGQPVVGATVQTENKTAVSNAAGIAVLTDLVPGVYQVKIGGPEYYDSLFTITIADADITQTVTITKTESAIAASNGAPVVSQPTPAPASRPVKDYSYKAPSGSGSAGNSSSNGSSGSKGESKNETVILDEIESDSSSDKNTNNKENEDSEIIESGELKPQTSATPSPQPTKTPAPTPTPEPVLDTAAYTVSFNLTNLNGTSIAGTTVELHSEVMTAKTDAQGFVTFEDVPEGEHNLYLLDAGGEVTATKAFSINSGVQTELDIANVGGDKIYVGMGTDAVTVDAVVDGSLMALTSVVEGTQPKIAPLPDEEQPSKEDNNIMWMLIISVSAAVIAIIILLLAIRKMRKAKSVDIHANGSAAMNADAKDVKGKFKR